MNKWKKDESGDTGPWYDDPANHEGDLFNDYVKCPRCSTITDYDDATVADDGICCTNCYGRGNE